MRILNTLGWRDYPSEMDGTGESVEIFFVWDCTSQQRNRI